MNNTVGGTRVSACKASPAPISGVIVTSPYTAFNGGEPDGGPPGALLKVPVSVKYVTVATRTS